jgi:RNA polymerase sigma factor (sigma-70 family)
MRGGLEDSFVRFYIGTTYIVRMTELMTDAQSLAEFSRTRSPEAMGALVQRHIDLVYATARRLVGDGHLAEDVTQAAFIVLVKKADRVDPTTLPGWLVNTTRLVAKAAMRSERTRDQYEARAARMRSESHEASDEPTAGELLPLLDEALSKLNDVDRTSVVMRFLQGRSFAEVAAAIGSSEEAARKRVGRVVEKLRSVFMRQGVVPSVGGLMVVLAAEQGVRAPVAIAASVTNSVMTGGTGSSALIAKGAVSMMTWTQIKFAAILAVALMALGGLGAGIAMVCLTGTSPPTTVTRGDRPSTAPATTSSSGTTADFYRDINQMLAVDCPASSDLTYPDYPPYGPEWDQMAKAAWQAGQPALARVREARSIGRADWPDRESSVRTGGTYLNPIRNVANHLGDAAMYQHLQGGEVGAIETVRDLFVLSDLMEQKPWDDLGRLLTAAGIRSLTVNRLMVIASDVRLSSDPADHQKLPTATARWLIDKLLNQNDPNEVWNGVAKGGQVHSEGGRQAMARLIETLNRANAEQTFAAMSLACHLFFMDHGRWPGPIEELIPAYLPHQSIDPWGDGHQTIGYVLVKRGLPDGSDRPMVYSRCGSQGKLFYRVDEPQYGFYGNDGSNANRPHHNPSGQFRDVARWLLPAGRVVEPTTRGLE